MKTKCKSGGVASFTGKKILRTKQKEEEERNKKRRRVRAGESQRSEGEEEK